MLKNVSYYLILLFLICLPLDHFYSEVFLIALTAHTALLARAADWKKLLDRKVLVLQVLYGVTLLTSLYSPYKSLALDDCFQQLPLLLFPWLCAVLAPVLIERRDQLLGAFCLSVTAVLLYLYADAIRVIAYFHLPLTDLFSTHFVNQQFSEPLGLHATYLSLYASLSLCWCIQQGLKRPRKNRYFVCAVFLCISLVQLSAKSAWIALALVGGLGFPYFFFSGRPRIAAFAASAVALGGLVLLLNGAFFHKRMIDDFKSDMVASKTENPMNQPRMVRWAAAWSLIKAAPLTGYGSGSEMPLLKTAYFEQGLYEPFLLKLNTHNQFLRWWLTSGIGGLAVYLALLGWALYKAISAHDLLWTGFMVMIITVSFAENILDVQHGLFFVSFFLSFFFFTKRPDHGSVCARVVQPLAYGQ
jgi:O-antigen ligase